MSTYKVIQDIEAEDKLIGPLSLRQFVYAAIVVIMSFLAFKLGQAQWFLALPFLPPIIFFATLAAPFGHDQSNEVWLLAKIRFFLKPQRRIWDQSNIKELVTITAPKKIERVLTNGLSQEEVNSRLYALANTIDSRGWAVKNINVNMFSQPSYVLNQPGSDRLIDPSSIPQNVPVDESLAADDILDEHNNSTAQHLDQMITASTQAHREQLIQQLQQPQAAAPQQAVQNNNQTGADLPANYWFMNQPAAVPNGYTTFDSTTPLAPTSSQPAAPVVQATVQPTADEQALLNRLHAEEELPNPAYGHLHTIEPLSGSKHKSKHHKQADDDQHTAEASKTPKATVPPVDPAILSLAHNDDLNVATLAREAGKNRPTPKDEVVISLR